MHHLPAAKPRPPRVLCTRVDALYLAYRGELRAEVRREIEARLADAKAAGTSVALYVAGHAFVLNSQSRPGRWVFGNDRVHMVFDESDHIAGWGLGIQADALLLATAGAVDALALVRSFADSLLELVTGERLRRLDLCADIENFELDEVDSKAWVTPQRASVTTHGTLGVAYADRHKGDRRTGFSIGRGDVVGRIYDKRAELALPNREEKRLVEEANWQASGWDGAASVTRVEVQLRGAALDELDGGGLRDPDRALDRSDALWGYFTRGWLRLVLPTSATRRNRCETDERWRIVQGARFGRDITTPLDRIRMRGTARARLAYSAVLGFAAASGSIGPLAIRSARSHVASWSDARCEGFVRAEVAAALSGVEQPIVAGLLQGLGPQGAASHMIEVRNARCARHTRAVNEGVARAQKREQTRLEWQRDAENERAAIVSEPSSKGYHCEREPMKAVRGTNATAAEARTEAARSGVHGPALV